VHSSTGLFAVFHALLRLLAPRHPPYALSSRSTELLSEAFQLAWAGGCATGSRTRSRHACDLLFRVLTALHKDSHRFWQRVGPMPRVSPLNSQVAFRSQFGGAVFNIADSSEGFHGSCLDLVSFPVRALSLSRLSASFFWLIPFSGNARVIRPC
jgi:hypothetical protein